MAQLWGGRFTKETDQLVYHFNASISFDRKLFEEDIEGSIAHAVMLEKQGILSEEEKNAIVKGLAGIRVIAPAHFRTYKFESRQPAS